MELELAEILNALTSKFMPEGILNLPSPVYPNPVFKSSFNIVTESSFDNSFKVPILTPSDPTKSTLCPEISCKTSSPDVPKASATTISKTTFIVSSFSG